MSQDEALTQSFLAQYVLARETYDPADYRDRYRRVTLWSIGAARDQYVRLMNPANPQSPLKANAPGSILRVVVKSVSIISPAAGIVRFDVQRQDASGSGPLQPYSAVVAYRYVGKPMRMGDRLLDPLGFQVTSYRRDAEAITPAQPGGGT